MKTASIEDVEARFSQFLKASAKEPIVLTRQGIPVAILYGTLDRDTLERLRLASNPKFQRILERGRREIKAERGIPHDEFWAEIARKYPKELGEKRNKRKVASSKRAG